MLTNVHFSPRDIAEASLGLKQHLNHLYCIGVQMLYYSVLHNNYRYKYILFLNYYCGDNNSEFNSYIKGFRNNHLPFCFSRALHLLAVHYIYYPCITFINRTLHLLTVHYIYYPCITCINRALHLLPAHYIY